LEGPGIWDVKMCMNSVTQYLVDYDDVSTIMFTWKIIASVDSSLTGCLSWNNFKRTKCTLINGIIVKIIRTKFYRILSSTANGQLGHSENGDTNV